MIAAPGRVLILDGPMGTELGARGAALPPPLWSAHALDAAPELVAAVHRDYAAAGAEVHTANTFRTSRRAAGPRWEELTHKAVRLARESAPPGALIAGSVAPLEDCYSPWLSPPNPGPEHALLTQTLARAGVDLLLCETFPHVPEGLAALEAALATGLETWIAWTAGPDKPLLSPAEVAAGAAQAIAAGARAVLVNCVPATRTSFYIERLADLGVPFGAYANAGHATEGLGWEAATPDAAERYADLAEGWVRAGATLLGGCCGTGPAHVAALAARFK